MYTYIVVYPIECTYNIPVKSTAIITIRFINYTHRVL